MNWGDKPYNNFNYYMKNKFGHKIIKLSLDGGFYCPNRDGTKGYGGCIFCSSMGSGEFAGNPLHSIENQIMTQKNILKKKWPSGKFIAYFQNFSNTYGDPFHLRDIYFQALKDNDVVGIAIATRPDCLNDEVIKLLSDLNKITYLWVELGIQTTNAKSLELLNTRYTVKEFYDSVCKLKKENIEVVAHQILGIPGESKKDMIKTAKDISDTGITGIKLHMLNILKDTGLEELYYKDEFYIMNINEYIELVVDILEILPQNIVIHRLTGDGAKNILIKPKWILNKRAVLNGILREMKIRNTYQGKKLY